MEIPIALGHVQMEQSLIMADRLLCCLLLDIRDSIFNPMRLNANPPPLYRHVNSLTGILAFFELVNDPFGSIGSKRFF
jgi:hypothetical protein